MRCCAQSFELDRVFGAGAELGQHVEPVIRFFEHDRALAFERTGALLDNCLPVVAESFERGRAFAEAHDAVEYAPLAVSLLPRTDQVLLRRQQQRHGALQFGLFGADADIRAVSAFWGHPRLIT